MYDLTDDPWIRDVGGMVVGWFLGLVLAIIALFVLGAIAF